MIDLKYNANDIANRLCYSDAVIAYYYSVCENYSNGYVQPFITNLQILITKLGIIVSKISTSPVNIAYCGTSLSYLCNDVLDRPSLERSFDEVGLNDKGNKGKHSIETNHIDMNRAVLAYNNLVQLIINQYNLYALKALIVVKKTSNARTNSPTPVTAKNRPSANNSQPHFKERYRTEDERIAITAELLSGDGYYKKGILHKKNRLNFILSLSICNPDNLKIDAVFAIFKCDGNFKKVRIIQSETPIDLDATLFSGNINAKVIVRYKLGLFKEKELSVIVAKKF